ncbi:hypothetical protein CLAFUW4_08036 [Fulvia fulva]|uniref:Uncharacterized protein n=1 Tax=Passalora fulva TaxID=5499 RepID=A0A9Q8P6H3_PASFU|nr:uncharacterized protein CLAFUR5_08154 [Fulvia fulva]KAK4629454.1 hypothetical protein CLAFUR4_08041 [Fulvia fulva]KAK4630538.1 hypothetical protein CLAFUR0_08036 [Fulvia fulva]UJO15150.1 hypothetical protein CLAFUR5_08154 [Fulvia fulva]WPV12941.1 hypothetical protein CLAFUW4_08036 [Fulvia fulva]WPV27066.1 hypothetical protein CLAFUW7_08036 [Fulvia fulva]
MASLTITTTDAQRNTFPFFDLPGEIRNYIYDELFIACSRPASIDLNLDCNIGNVTDPTACRISKQFRSEYLARAGKHPIVTQFTDHIDFDGTLRYPMPRPVYRTEIVKLRLFATAVEGHSHLDWLEPLLERLPRVTEVEIKVALRKEVVDEQSEEVERWMVLRNLRSVVVYCGRGRKLENFFSFDEPVKHTTVKK